MSTNLAFAALFFLLIGMSTTAQDRLLADSAQPDKIVVDSGWKLVDTAQVSSGGDIISTVNFPTKSWLKATVPGTVLTSMVDDGIYPEPLYGENNRPNRISDSLCRSSYWYRTTFSLPHSYAGRDVWLNFDGINYKAKIWLNGQTVGEIDGAFSRGLFDIGKYARVGALNALAVEILPPPDPGNPVEQTIAAGAGPNGGVLARDGATFLCTIGWDWIPGIRDRDMGIWQKVYLSSTGPVTIRNTYVTSVLPLPRLDSADLNLETTLANGSLAPITGDLVGSFDSAPTFRVPITLAAGEVRTIELDSTKVPGLHVLNPRLWWPNGYGPQNLYTMHLRFMASSQVSDSSETSFGIRQMSYSVPTSENLTISVNGVPILAKGGDWGIDEAMKREPYKRLDAQIRMHKIANYTIIRNWVGQSTSEDFYSLCDKYGIMIWDEFFQPNPSDGPNPDDNAMYLANVKEKILRFRSHPSIAVWCGRNEGFPPPAIDTAIRQIMAEVERGRLYQPSSTSGHGVNSGGPYRWRTPAEYYKYDEPFKTEIGSVSIPTLESIESMMPKQDWNVINDDWAEHDLAAGAQEGDRYPLELAERYGPIASLADFARKGQMANYEAFRAMYEGRNAKLFNPVTGVITWMSNPAQPSFVWQLYSWDLVPNSSLFGTEKACEPIHIQMNQDDWHVMAINNTPIKLLGLTVKVGVYNLTGKLVFSQKSPATAEASAATDLGPIDFPSNVTTVHFIKLTLLDSRGRQLSDNFYWRETIPGNLQALNDLPMVALDGTVKSRVIGDRLQLTVTLTNNTATPAILSHIQLFGRRSGKRIIPSFYSDNYVSLLSGESNDIIVDVLKSDVGSDEPVIKVDGWNVTVKQSAGIEPDSAAIVINKPVDDHLAASFPAPVRIDCGGNGQRGFFSFGVPTGSVSGFVGDRDYVGGSTKTVSDQIAVGSSNSAPASVYQSERWGPTTYTIPVFKGSNYTVRLHFCETTFDEVGARKFDVDINDKRILTDFDVFATAGGKDVALVVDTKNVAPDANGDIVISFTEGSADQPKVSGIEALP